MAKKISGNQDGKGGRNESYYIPGRGDNSRNKLTREVDSGKHPNHSIYERNGEKFIRSNPNAKDSDNINQ